MLNYLKFKEINELFVQGNFEEARVRLMELQACYIALCDEVDILKKQVREFENILFLSQNLVAEGEGYWLRTGGVRQGPFCRPCYEYAGKLIRLESRQSVWRCPYCGLLHSREQISGTSPDANGRPERPAKVIPFSAPARHC